MAQPKIFITRLFPGSAIELLTSRYDVQINADDTVLSPDELKRSVAGVDAIVALLTDKITAEVMDAAGLQLKLIANYAVGFDNIDIAAAKARGITVTNTPGTLGEAVSEYTFALVLAVARKVVPADQFMKAHRYKQWEPALFLGMELKGKTFGAIGLGQIGAGAVRIAHGFGMKSLYYDAVRHYALEKALGVQQVSLEELLRGSDIVSLHVPLTETTHHLIGAEQLQQMKSTAILINTARGPIIDEAALIEALKNGQIAGAGLDVFENEPTISNELASLPNVVLTPHVGSATIEARQAMSQIVADNVISFFEEGKALTPVEISTTPK